MPSSASSHNLSTDTTKSPRLLFWLTRKDHKTAQQKENDHVRNNPAGLRPKRQNTHFPQTKHTDDVHGIGDGKSHGVLHRPKQRSAARPKCPIAVEKKAK